MILYKLKNHVDVFQHDFLIIFLEKFGKLLFAVDLENSYFTYKTNLLIIIRLNKRGKLTYIGSF
ncbi:hypothetical protein Hs30E_07150 [Lactococcus hodotermopsidis]|uniref:Uncharacterized protein n=1 Tax=Pseudolactococcus hodotermopsidis TaxID=2709157 RepID=A0A6A0BCK8_9LACT|nr:hypothetical protein Hs30E_07150 [Lactococcus hodotermopsidis]